jgi:heme/copper-type cytochrome/quinol oxidase subunit 3
MTMQAPAIPIPRADAPPGSRPNGWWGMVLLIATEATLFALLLATYFYLRTRTSAGWPPDRLSDPKILKPLLATIILVLSSAPIAIAARAAGRLRPAAARIGVLFAVGLGVAFLIFQYLLVQESLDKFRPGKDAYGSIFYTLIGLHAAHVAAGVLLALWAFARSVRFDRTAILTVRVTTLYWHFVNVVAVVVFLTLYLSPRG